jgi:transcriptional regulator with XRE-family HTH domain
MNRSDVLRRALESTGMSQVDLSRHSGLPPSKISRYLSGRLEPSEPTLGLLLSCLGVRVSFDVTALQMERTKLRSWLLHRLISKKLGTTGISEADWDRMQLTVNRIRGGIAGVDRVIVVGSQSILGSFDIDVLPPVTHLSAEVDVLPDVDGLPRNTMLGSSHGIR